MEQKFEELSLYAECKDTECDFRSDQQILRDLMSRVLSSIRNFVISATQLETNFCLLFLNTIHAKLHIHYVTIFTCLQDSNWLFHSK